MTMDTPEPTITRRSLLRRIACGASLAGLGGLGATLAARSGRKQMRWQIDPHKCINSAANSPADRTCSNCASLCVLQPSAVKCVQVFKMCGYCDLCTGYFDPEPNDLNTGAENQLCPTSAIIRKFVETPYFEYTIDEDLCIACGKCVKGCIAFGNGSLFLQVNQDLCVNCNDCAIAAGCPADAFVRVPVDAPYILKGTENPS